MIPKRASLEMLSFMNALNPMTDIDILSLARDTITLEAQAIQAVVDQLDETFVEVTKALLACEGHVLVAGSGTSHATALRMAHLLSCCGTPALFIHPGDAQHGTSGAVTPKDIVILISRGGETDEVNKLGTIAKQRGATVIAFTERPASTIGKLSDLILQVRADPAADIERTITTGGSLCMSAVGDALCAVLMKLRGYSMDSFAATHPGGAVGKSLK